MNYVSNVATFNPGSTSKDEIAAQPPLGSEIAQYRRRKGLSITKLADMLGVSRQAVWYWEAGHREPSQEIVGKLNELGVTQVGCWPPVANFAMLIRNAKLKLAQELGVAPASITISIKL